MTEIRRHPSCNIRGHWWSHRPLRAFSSDVTRGVGWAVRAGLLSAMPPLPVIAALADYLASAPWKPGRRWIRVAGFGALERPRSRQQLLPWASEFSL